VAFTAGSRESQSFLPAYIRNLAVVPVSIPKPWKLDKKVRARINPPPWPSFSLSLSLSLSLGISLSRCRLSATERLAAREDGEKEEIVQPSGLAVDSLRVYNVIFARCSAIIALVRSAEPPRERN